MSILRTDSFYSAGFMQVFGVRLIFCIFYRNSSSVLQMYSIAPTTFGISQKNTLPASLRHRIFVTSHHRNKKKKKKSYLTNDQKASILILLIYVSNTACPKELSNKSINVYIYKQLGKESGLVSQSKT